MLAINPFSQSINGKQSNDALMIFLFATDNTMQLLGYTSYLLPNVYIPPIFLLTSRCIDGLNFTVTFLATQKKVPSSPGAAAEVVEVASRAFDAHRALVARCYTFHVREARCSPSCLAFHPLETFHTARRGVDGCMASREALTQADRAPDLHHLHPSC